MERNHVPTTLLQDPIIQHMHTDFAALSSEQTVAAALDFLRNQPPQGRIIYLYVTNASGRLCGVVPTRRLLLSPPENRISEIMVPHVIAVSHSSTVLEACEFFTLHRLLAFPVIDDDRHLVGVIDVELYTDELNELSEPDEIFEKADDLFQLIGVHLHSARQGSPLRSFIIRFPWLMCNIGGGILAAFLAGMFEVELKKAVALALFIPVVLAIAESVSIQSVTLGLHSMKERVPSWRTLLTKLAREALTGCLLGCGCVALVGSVASIWIGQWRVTLCLAGGIFGGVLVASIIGFALPYLLKLWHRDPGVASGPIALALADMFTLVIYFNLARSLL